MRHFVRLALGVLLMFSVTLPVRAGDFYLNLYGASTNFWSSSFIQMPTYLLNDAIGILAECAGLIDEDHYPSSSVLRYEFFTIKNAGSKVHLKDGNYFGFKARDLFANVEYGLRFGWQPAISPFGVYVQCTYQLRQFRAEWEPDVYTKYRLSYIRPGVGIRLVPIAGCLRDPWCNKWTPMLELGTSYVKNLGCKAPYDNDKSQFADGMTTDIGIGIRNKTVSWTLCAEFDNYDMFDRDYTPDNGLTFPYADVKTRHVTLSINFSKYF